MRITVISLALDVFSMKAQLQINNAKVKQRGKIYPFGRFFPLTFLSIPFYLLKTHGPLLRKWRLIYVRTQLFKTDRSHVLFAEFLLYSNFPVFHSFSYQSFERCYIDGFLSRILSEQAEYGHLSGHRLTGARRSACSRNAS